MNNALTKQERLNALYEPYKNCLACPLGFLGRTTIVFGEGNPDAQLMFIGEAPGADEDVQGRPFVGRSGKLLTKVIEIAGLTRKEVFIANIVKCRPPNNRPPTQTEATTCKNLLLKKQIDIIKPKLICTLGSSALNGLLDQQVKISHVRGTILHHNGLAILPTFHPAYVLRSSKQMEKFTNDIIMAKKITLGY